MVNTFSHLNERRQNHQQQQNELISRQDSSTVEVSQFGIDQNEAKRRLSIGVPTERISFNLESGYFDSSEALKALAEQPGLSKSSTRSFHSEKDLEDYILGNPVETEIHMAITEPIEKPSSESSASSTSEGSFDGSSLKSGVSKAPKIRKPNDPVLEGILSFEKAEGSWKEKNFGLTPTSLGYFRKIAPIIKSRTFVELIKLSDIKEVFHDEHCFLLDENCFAIDTGSSKFFFRAKNRAEMASWMVSLARQRNLGLKLAQKSIY